jgi:hypothetical protein
MSGVSTFYFTIGLLLFFVFLTIITKHIRKHRIDIEKQRNRYLTYTTNEQEEKEKNQGLQGENYDTDE